MTAGRVEALMKGSLHTDELMGAVVSRQAGIRTARRISHCFIMDVPNHPDALIITDAAVNIAPTLDDKVDIVQNAIDLAHAMGVAGGAGGDPERDGDGERQGAVDHRGRGAVQDGGSRPDHRRAAGRTAGAGQRDQPARRRRSSGSLRRWRDAPTCWWFRTSKPATCWRRACRSWRRPTPPGIVLGARVPIILTSRADSLLTRLASCAVAVMVAAARRRSAAASIR